MKGLLICGSLIANAALLGALAYRPALAPPAMRNWFAGAAAAPTAASAAKPKAPAPAPKVWAQLDTTDLHLLVQRLEGAGFPPSVIRSIVAMLVNEQFSDRMRGLMLPDPNTPYWKLRPQIMGIGDKRYTEMMDLQHERSKEIRDLTQDLGANDADVTAAQRRRYGSLSAAKIAMVQRIDDDYADMMANVRAGMKGIELKEDRDALIYLQKQKQADLAAILTPDELAEYNMRTSPITSMLRGRLSAFDATEAEYRSIFQAYQTVSQDMAGKIGPGIPMDMQTRTDAQQKLTTTLQSSLGDARYDQFVQATSMDYQQLARIAQQQNLPPDTVSRAIALRDGVAQQSTQIAQDPAMSYADKLAALKTLGANTRLQLEALVPGSAGQTYVQRAGWLNMLDHGMGVSFVSQPPLIIATDMGGTYSIGAPGYRPVPVRRTGGH